MQSKLFIERDTASGEWVVFEWAGNTEYIRGRYTTELEAAMRLAELKPPSFGQQLVVEEIDGGQSWTPVSPQYKNLSAIYNNPEKMWLVLGGPNNHDLKVLRRFSTEGQAKRYISQIKREKREALERAHKRVEWGPKAP